MGSFADFWEKSVLDHIFMKTSYTQPTNIFVALSTTTITDAGLNVTEPSGGAYARVSTAGADWNAAVGSTVDNLNAITFPQATGFWGNIIDFALFDASSAGNTLAYGTLSLSIDI